MTGCSPPKTARVTMGVRGRRGRIRDGAQQLLSPAQVVAQRMGGPANGRRGCARAGAVLHAPPSPPDSRRAPLRLLRATTAASCCQLRGRQYPPGLLKKLELEVIETRRL